MSADTPMIVFVGSDAQRAELESQAAYRSWYVFEPTEDALFGPLAQVVTFFPDAVVVEDTGDPLQHEVARHLASIDFQPLVLLTDHPEAWRAEDGAFDVVLPRDARAYEVLDALRALLQDAEPVCA
ncbi:MAG: hypothetical protein IPK19_28660 [Chloroflexi bacterium]|nr:hypothetical protein [Chloroflexota bacterium]